MAQMMRITTSTGCHMNTKTGIATLAALAAIGLAACGGDDVKGGAGAGREYEVVAEGSASGVDPSLASGVPPLTNTNADTTTAFSSVPGSADPTSTAMAPLPPLVGTPYPAGYPQAGSAVPGGYSQPAPSRRESSINISRSTDSGSSSRPAPRPATSWPSQPSTPPVQSEQPQQPTQPAPTPTEPQPAPEPAVEDAEESGEESEEEVAPPPPSTTSTAGTSAPGI